MWDVIIGGALAIIGGMCATILSARLERERNRIDRLFEAKKECYAKVNIAIRTAFGILDADMRGLDDKTFDYNLQIKVQQSIAEALLLAKKPLAKKLGFLADATIDYWKNSAKTEYKEIAHKQLALVHKLRPEIEQDMREELGIED